MNIVVLASDEQWGEMIFNTGDIQWIRAELPFSFLDYASADAFFILTIPEITDYTQTGKPVFINSVTNTLKELRAPAHVLRINGWNTFLKRSVWEIAGVITNTSSSILQQMNKKAITVADEPGLVAATIIAMIINEAYFALEGEVSTKAAIDTAMKLGTNYPYGPFDWAEKIGLESIAVLLQKLSTTGNRYQPSSLLISEIRLHIS